ncbi:hypothetical protein D3C80_1461050 [compost metagenome]
MLAAGGVVLFERCSEGILHSLSRLGEIRIRIAALQELNQLCQPGRVVFVFFINVKTRLLHCWLRRNLFESVVVFRRIRQRASRIFQQVCFGAALLIIGIHHHTGGGTAQVDTRLQHQVPGRGQFTLLQTQIVCGRVTLLILF